jgi:tetratricopeptide (TPR) repeat protein
MKKGSLTMRRCEDHTHLIWLAACWLMVVAARADSINYGGLVVNNISIDKFDGKQIYYRTESGNVDQRVVSDRVKINVNDEPNLDLAEDAFGAANWSDAVDGYMKAIRSTNKPWVRDYASVRLQTAAAKSHRFDAAVAAWVQEVNHDPKWAAAHTPTLPADSNSTYLRTAVTQLETAAAGAKDDVDKVATIRTFQLQIAKAMHDDQLISDLASELTALLSQHQTTALNSDDVHAVVMAQLGLVHVSLDKKDFATAQKKLLQLKGSVVEPADQADWLWCDAQAKAGPIGNDKDAAALKDAELAYMRLVAHFPNSAQAPQALYNTAELMERGGDIKTALDVCQQIAQDYPGQPVAQQAAAAARRMQSEENK